MACCPSSTVKSSPENRNLHLKHQKTLRLEIDSNHFYVSKLWQKFECNTWLFILSQLDSNCSKKNMVVWFFFLFVKIFVFLLSLKNVHFSAKHGSLAQLFAANSDRKAHIIKLCYVVHYAYQCLESSRNIIYPQLMTHSVKILVLLESQPKRQ